ncbi:Hypothetical protein, putative [Bodo saltans]|uniref:RING-type domain-containing protein n=1 Tax=Bodo saltans TaxID=75058 RepID=A0A0S4JS85_BODSA|nr:Hypothetical protein, putative [Bodo saltans]|eukprot:CUG94347.1 Hypothetical protein, putative [Bodo saltans]
MEIPHSCLCTLCQEPMTDAVSIEPCHDNICHPCACAMMSRVVHRCPVCRGQVKMFVKDHALSNAVTEIVGLIKKWRDDELSLHKHQELHTSSSGSCLISGRSNKRCREEDENVEPSQA